MTILDYLLLGGFGAAGFYTIYRLLLGWLRTSSDEINNKILEIPRRTAKPALVRGLASKSAGEVADMRGQLR